MRAIFSDLDGSLHDGRTGFHPDDYASLKALQGNALRVIITGRSLQSARKVLSPEFPIDYLVFASGAGVMDWSRQQLLFAAGFRPTETEQVVTLLHEWQLDFMLHDPIPDNHCFQYRCFSALNPDFARRLQLYQDVARPFQPGENSEACAALAIVPEAETARYFEQLQAALPDLSIIRATSPLDLRSGWLEIFPGHISKSQAAERLSQMLGIQEHMAFGNDYNDQDLLGWAQRAFVVADAPETLRQRFEVVARPSEAGFSQALRRWLKER